LGLVLAAHVVTVKQADKMMANGVKNGGDMNSPFQWNIVERYLTTKGNGKEVQKVIGW
jgi:hypothetical protein